MMPVVPVLANDSTYITVKAREKYRERLGLKSPDETAK